MKCQSNDTTFCGIVEYISNLSNCINDMYNICPKIFLRFNHQLKVTGAAILTYRIPDMYIELDIPHNYTFGQTHKAILGCVLIHEYCHHISALEVSGRDRISAMVEYEDDQQSRRSDEQRNWTATKHLAKKLGLWNKAFHNITRNYYYTTSLRF